MFKIEDIKNNPHQQEVLRWIDVLVDGEYKEGTILRGQSQSVIGQ